MIKSIKELSLGIFQNYKNDGVDDFKKYNLFYGYNASGKSTIAHLFRCIEHRANLEKYGPQLNFTINCDNNTKITQDNFAETKLKIRTFDKDFVNDNISWKGAINSILIIGEEKISEVEELEKLQREQEDAEVKRDSIEREKDNLKKEIDQFGTTNAKQIKTNFGVIGTLDRYYMNYDKRKFKDFVDKNEDLIKSKNGLLDKQKLSTTGKAAKPVNPKEKISHIIGQIEAQNHIQTKTRLDGLLKESVANKTIERLLGNSDIQSWIEEGLDIHKRNQISQCEFCGNNIPEERIKELEDHFNDNYKSFKNKLSDTVQEIGTDIEKLKSEELPAVDNFFDEFQNRYIRANKQLQEIKDNLIREIEKWRDILNKKIENPFQTDLSIDPITEDLINEYNRFVETINRIVKEHNSKTDNIAKETTTAQGKLELHYATEAVNGFGYFEKKEKLKNKESDVQKIKNRIQDRKTEISNLESSLSDAHLGAIEFNQSLHKFIGHDNLSLRFSSDKKGYEILRNNSVLAEDNLSEGEKTAIAFIYFIVKLKENNNQIKDTIIVIDDPVSSFDSNHLFNAYSFMRNECGEAEQLFILTHNFMFFKLVRDWFLREKETENLAKLYVVESKNSPSRRAEINNAPVALTQYDSEYHFIFDKLYSLKEANDILNTNDYYLVANLCRKLLEAFLSFKFPMKRKKFDKLLEVATNYCENFDNEKKNKIFKFVGKYSHCLPPFETDGDPIENLIGEGVEIISDTFECIEEVDRAHYQEMLNVIDAT